MHMPDGLDTLAGENGIMLSGGQKQRILLARMLLTPPRLYLLDDATSALDGKTERKILETLRERIRRDNGAAVIVSDSDNVKAMADRILSIGGNAS